MKLSNYLTGENSSVVKVTPLLIVEILNGECRKIPLF